MSEQEVREVAVRARAASVALSSVTRSVKDAALHAMADALVKASSELIEVNQRDIRAAVENGTSAAMIDRLTLTESRIEAMADGLRQVAALPDPVGEVVRGSTLANGLEVRQLRVPMGVVGIVYEARPNVTVDAAGLCLKSGNAALLRGSGSAYRKQSRAHRRLTRCGRERRLARGRGQPGARHRPRLGEGLCYGCAVWST